MSVQPIRLVGDPVLRTPATEVTDFGPALRDLVRDLWDMMESRGAAGVAAPQVGVGLRVFAYHCDGFAGHVVNPRLQAVRDDVQDGPEGCLSIPGLTRDCRRRQEVLARGWNQHGEPVEIAGAGLLARCLQHEIDHLDGVLFVDRLDARSREQALADIRSAAWFHDAVPECTLDPRSVFGGH